MSRGCVMSRAVTAWSISMQIDAMAFRHRLDIMPPKCRNSNDQGILCSVSLEF